MTRKEAIAEMKSAVEGHSFMAVLDYYHIPVVKNSILCPFHNDNHYGSCRIDREEKGAICFVCNKHFDSIDLVMQKEGLKFVDALTFLYENVLGYPRIDTDDSAARTIVLSAKELKFIGLPYSAKGTVNIIEGEFDSKMDIPKECSLSDDVEFYEDEPVYLAQKKLSYPGLYEMGKDLYLDMVEGKCQETIRSLKALKRKLTDEESLSECKKYLMKAYGIKKKINEIRAS